MTNKEIIRIDYGNYQKKSKFTKGLGEYALDRMKIYDDVCYELVLIDATANGKRVTGSAIMNDLEKMKDLIAKYSVEGDFHIKTIDTQKEFFCLLSEIRDELNQEL